MYGWGSNRYLQLGVVPFDFSSVASEAPAKKEECLTKNHRRQEAVYEDKDIIPSPIKLKPLQWIRKEEEKERGEKEERQEKQKEKKKMDKEWITQVACGMNHTMCVTSSGSLIGFGCNDSGIFYSFTLLSLFFFNFFSCQDN